MKTDPIHTALRNQSKALIRNLSYMVLRLTVLSFRLSFPWDNYLKVCLGTRDLRAKISGCIVKVQRPGNKSRGTATSFITSVVFIHLICATGNFMLTTSKEGTMSEFQLYNKLRLKKQGRHTLHRPRGVTITVRMRTAISPGQVSDRDRGGGGVGPWPHHFSAPPPPLFALKRKIMKMKNDLSEEFRFLH